MLVLENVHMSLVAPVFVSVVRRPPISTLVPYTTLFRSDRLGGGRQRRAGAVRVRDRAGERRCSSAIRRRRRSEEHTSELQSRFDLVCRLLLEKKKSCMSADASIANAR